MLQPAEFTDVLYEVRDSAAIITINRPDRYNAMRGRTVWYMRRRSSRAGWPETGMK